MVPPHQVMANLSPTQRAGRGIGNGGYTVSSGLQSPSLLKAFYWSTSAVDQTTSQCLKAMEPSALLMCLQFGQGLVGRAHLFHTASAGVTQLGAEGLPIKMAHRHGCCLGAQSQLNLWASVSVPEGLSTGCSGFLAVWWSQSKSEHPYKTWQKCMALL